MDIFNENTQEDGTEITEVKVSFINWNQKSA